MKTHLLTKNSLKTPSGFSWENSLLSREKRGKLCRFGYRVKQNPINKNEIFKLNNEKLDQDENWAQEENVKRCKVFEKLCNG